MSLSPSTGTAGPTSLRTSLPRPSVKLFLRVAAAFALSLALWFVLRLPYTRLVVTGGGHVLSRFNQADPSDIVWEEDGQFKLDTGIPLADGGHLIWDLEQVRATTWNAVFLCSLVFLTPWRRLKKLWWYALLAALLLWLTQVATFSLNTLTQLASLYEQKGLRSLSPSTISMVSLARDYLFALNPVLPFLIYLPAFFLPVAGRQAPAASTATPRNAPCPCGSGRKYKHCCGRS